MHFDHSTGNAAINKGLSVGGATRITQTLSVGGLITGDASGLTNVPAATTGTVIALSQTLSVGGATTLTGTLSVGGASPTFHTASVSTYMKLQTDAVNGQAMITTLNDNGDYTFGTNSDDSWGIYDNNATAYRLIVDTSGNVNLYNSLSVSGTSLIDNIHIGKHATASGDSSIGFFSHSSANSSCRICFGTK